MKSHIAETNIVLVLRNPDYRYIDPFWLVENKVCDREDINKDNAIFMPDLIQIVNDKFQILCMSNRITITIEDTEENRHARLTRMLTPFLNEGKSLNPVAMGINIKYLIEPSEEEFPKVNSNLLRNSTCPASVYFQGNDARYGSYFSANFESLRLKLDIKPAIMTSPQGTREFIEMNFNFHKDFAKPYQPAESIEMLSLWPKCWDHSEKIMKAMLKE